MDPWEILIRPVISEKGMLEAEQAEPKYLFKVRINSNKQQIRQAVEQAFNVKVKKVNTLRTKGKPRRVRMAQGRTARWKKAIVTLEKDQKIELF